MKKNENNKIDIIYLMHIPGLIMNNTSVQIVQKEMHVFIVFKKNIKTLKSIWNNCTFPLLSFRLHKLFDNVNQ